MHTAEVLLAAIFTVLPVAVAMELRDPVLRREMKRQFTSMHILGHDLLPGLTGSMPLFLCKPSQFWLTRYFKIPLFCNSTSAM